MPELMATLADKPGQAAKALRLLILTAARSGEIRGMRWSEIDLAAKLWTVPASRMKAGKVHRVPLSDAALAVLAEVHTDAPRAADALIFPGTRGQPLSDMTLTAMLRGIGMKDAAGEIITAHGCRSSFRDWAAEIGQPADLAEAALAHAAGDKVTVAYLRSDMLGRRAALMVAWAAACFPSTAFPWNGSYRAATHLYERPVLKAGR